jgi:hypothetical protein
MDGPLIDGPWLNGPWMDARLMDAPRELRGSPTSWNLRQHASFSRTSA